MTGSGEVVEVRAGGHIVRAGGRKDRHSKVCTAKGVRDRRVRLSAHTAIQFYDVQDRLGYDRPSKAVDWLIRNAKPAIDRLSQRHQSPQKPPFSSGDYGFCGSSSCFLPPSLDSDSIADTIRSFFPTAAAAAAAASSSSSYHPDEDLRLSLQSFQDPIFGSQQQCRSHQAALFGFDAGSSAWLEPSQRAAAWNLVQTQLAAQWGTLQSSNPPSVRADGDPTSMPHQLNLAGEVVGFSGYQVQGGEEAEEEEQRAPSFASSALRH